MYATLKGRHISIVKLISKSRALIPYYPSKVLNTTKPSLSSQKPPMYANTRAKKKT
jgi:hypothetical protein